ncbi:hypothetical protein XENTR_v10020055 [Xenopus tropicalis]|uniref:Uncharacterized protein LOC101732925 n=1 Tax=Xenopus tropicalis TaxID=8364 RepID=A0A8J0R4J2_XENTR|nr:uncharacterized protein LOC101732925 [Xenopus tropicalis]KAE8582286.1 hypothetical protein XENTR_v10020055 [Xenopus tropicalis]|eukprot:XP_004917593.1 PREDICTED: uncharacterized protein LOC101732925 [Xenopus tropicalis]
MNQESGSDRDKMPQADPPVHTVRIQQSYWVTDASEERLLQSGAVLLAREVTQVDYYDTDTYDLAMKGAWLSKSRGKWQLIVDQGGSDSTTANQKGDDPSDADAPTCYELLDEREIVAYLARLLPPGGKSSAQAVGDFIRQQGVRHYGNYQSVTRATYRLTDAYTVTLSAEPAAPKQAALIRGDVGIDGVTRGFQRMEELAGQLDLLPQTKA